MSNSWSDEELEASVQAYFEMYTKHANQIPFSKKDCYRALYERFGRTEKAFEYRMQNISYVMVLEGMEYLPGLKPAENVGKNNIPKLQTLIQKVFGSPIRPTPPLIVNDSYKSSRLPINAPVGVKKPASNQVSVTQYSRDPTVKEWVLYSAGGECESCGDPAPFITQDGKAFLETHHIKQLANGGSDTISNCIALCPNCHRAFHYSDEAEKLVEKAYKTIIRLKRE
ncbi:MAG: HNH endonuclease [Limnobaculum xujianqingii]